MPSDPRPLALIIYHKLRADLSVADDEMSRGEAIWMVKNALALLPSSVLELTSDRERIILHTLTGERVEFDLQQIVDALLLLWSEYSENQQEHSYS